jgi:hypothetical protein
MRDAVNSWMHPIGDLASYAACAHGGARLARRIEGARSTERGTVRNSCQPSLLSPKEGVMAIMAGRSCQGLVQTEAFVTAAWQTLRLHGEDSSISARMACKSSLAEITGNSRTNTQPRTHRKMSGEDAGLFARPSGLVEEVRCRHNIYAGSSRDTQQRLRKSSIANSGFFGKIDHEHNGATASVYSG